jgi:membrane associated rhomboid family serine protease
MVDQDQNSDLSPVRPRFLTFLCYLTIFASTYMIFSAFSGLSDPESTVKAMTNSMDQWESVLQDAVKNDPSGQSKVDELIGDIAASNTSSNMRDNSFFSLITNLLTMFGAFILLRLKKNGFRLYVLGCIIAVVAPLLVFGSDNIMGFSLALMAGLSGALFILLYALKMKYME